MFGVHKYFSDRHNEREYIGRILVSVFGQITKAKTIKKEERIIDETISDKPAETDAFDRRYGGLFTFDAADPHSGSCSF